MYFAGEQNTSIYLMNMSWRIEMLEFAQNSCKIFMMQSLQ
ncbi:hypothetical protein BH11PSE12_BH11PSE12_01980 [soil metagenome]